MKTLIFPVEVTLPVSNVDRTIRSYAHQVGFTIDVDYAPGRDPAHGDYASSFDFSDPNGNGWVLQERGCRNG
jgi:hypothetical protein